MEALTGNGNVVSSGMRFRLPTVAWAEVRDPTGERISTLAARLERGAIVVDVPAFARGMRGTIALIVDGGFVERTLTVGAADLPTKRTEWVIEFREERGSAPQPAAL